MNVMRQQTTHTRFGSLISGLLIFAFGAAFAITGWWGMEQVRPYDDGVLTTGHVVGTVEGSVVIDGIARSNYSPVYEFDTVDGERYRITDHMTATSRPLATGSTVELSYRPEDPASVRRIDDDRSWLWWFVIGGTPVAAVGALAVIGALVGLIRRRPGGVRPIDPTDRDRRGSPTLKR